MPKVTIQPSGQSVELPFNSTLTDLAQITPKVIPFGCRSGACGACAIAILEGSSNLIIADGMERKFLSTLGYPEDCYRLACKCRLKGDIVIRSIHH